MKRIIQVLGVLIVLTGITLLVAPDVIFKWLEYSLDNQSLYYMAIIFRALLGILLIAGAKRSKYPLAISIVGYLAILAAVVFVLMGADNFYSFFSSFIQSIRPYAPYSGLFGLAIGAFLIHAFTGSDQST